MLGLVQLANKVISVKNDQPLTDSRTVAKYFHKQPNKVNNRIAKIINIRRGRNTIPALNNRWFYKGHVMISGNRALVYYMNKDGFIETVLGFRGKRAEVLRMQFTEVFDYMLHALQQKRQYKHQIPQTYSQALIVAGKEAHAKELVQVKNKQMTPTYDYGRALSANIVNAMTIASASHKIANYYHSSSFGRNKCFVLLRALNILQKVGRNKNTPYQYYIEHKWFVPKHSTSRSSYGKFLNTTWLMTTKGLKGVIQKLNRIEK